MRYTIVQEMLKVSETKYECDFCQGKSYALYPINDGLWAVCKVCMDLHYTILPDIQKLKEPSQETIPSTRYTIYGDEEE